MGAGTVGALSLVEEVLRRFLVGELVVELLTAVSAVGFLDLRVDLVRSK